MIRLIKPINEPSYPRDNSAILSQSPYRRGGYDLDVGSGHPNGAAAIKGSFVQRLKSYVI